MLPLVAVIDVPALTAPAVATMFPVVAVSPVPAVIVVVEATLVVAKIDPGAVIALGKESVTDPLEFVTVIWLAVPAIETTDPDPEVACQLAMP
jgi:hypothetical protein